MIGWYNLYPMKPSYFRILHTSHSDPTPIRLRVHHSNSDITPTVPRHSPSHAAFHRRSPRSTEFYRIISEITEILLVIIRYILTTDRQPSPLSRVLRHRKNRPGVDFFAKANYAGLTNLHNQEHI